MVALADNNFICPHFNRSFYDWNLCTGGFRKTMG